MRIRSSGPAQIVGELSGGNQQKVVIGRWLARDCRVLLFDEPTRGIDVGAKFDIYGLMGALAREGRALVVVSSDLRELMLICDRIGVMSAGRMTGVFERDSWTQDALLAAAFAGYAAAKRCCTPRHQRSRESVMTDQSLSDGGERQAGRGERERQRKRHAAGRRVGAARERQAGWHAARLFELSGSGRRAAGDDRAVLAAEFALPDLRHLQHDRQPDSGPGRDVGRA